jgi:nucleotide-binding universal stress UspA family protein
MFTHILIPTDGSATSRKAVKAGIALAKKLGAKVTGYYALETVQPYLYTEGAVMPSVTIDLLEQRMTTQGERFLAVIEKTAQTAGVDCEVVMTPTPSPSQGILDVAKKRKCDAIFMGSHGHGGLTALILGSVTQKVLANAKVPVVVFR